MNTNKKLINFISHDVLSFIIGVLVASILSFQFKLGDWVSSLQPLFNYCLLALIFALAYLRKKAE